MRIEAHHRHRRHGVAALLALAPVLIPTGGPARASITPLLNASSVVSSSSIGPLNDTKIEVASGTPDPWNGNVFSYIADGPAFAYGSMTMSFVADTDGLRITSGGACGADTYGEGVNKGAANLDVFFIANTVQEADFTTTLTLRDIPGTAGGLLFPFDVRGNVPYRTLALNWGTTTTRGRIPPGTYLVDAWAKYDSTSATGTAPSFSMDALFTDVTNPLVTTQPSPQTTQAGATTNFSVGTGGSLTTSSVASAPTFQWRRNLVNLANGGRISGVTTSHLVIASTAVADTGFYDVIVAQDTIVEPSSLAKLTVTTSSTGVGPPATIRGVELDMPVPNPAYGRTRVRFALPGTMTAGLDVLDVAGRIVKTLVPYGVQEAGARTAEWDGTIEGGSRAAAGIYFVRLRAGSNQLVRRVVKLASD
jgi:FlgD Ig-like domain